MPGPDPEEHARRLAEKTRLDPPPEGREWSLGYGADGQRVPEYDRLVDTSRELVADPIDYGTDEHGVREELVSAVLDEWASRKPHLEGEQAVREAVDSWAPRDLAQMAAAAVVEQLRELNGHTEPPV